MIDFLFASQDASTASLVWCLTLMADNPDMLAKVGGVESGASEEECSWAGMPRSSGTSRPT